VRQQDSNSSVAFSANTEVKTGEVFYDLLKIHQKIKGRLVDGEVFILRQEQALQKMSQTRGYNPPVPPP
jgi:hypothetical protein